jgi:agmatine/peptidylarginine deiminase
VLQSCFPDRKVVGIDCTDLVWGLGACHCVSQQWPASGPKAERADGAEVREK